MSSLSHGDKPPRDSCRYVKRFAVANHRAVYVGFFARYHARLTDDQLWLSWKLSIPVRAIRAKEIIKRGWLIRRYALKIVFESPGTGLDAVHLCDIDFLGFYYRRNLEKLSAAIDEVLARTGGMDVSGAVAEMPAVRKATLRGVLFQSLGNLFGSTDRLSVGIYRDVARSIGVELEGRSVSADEARLQLASAAEERGLDQLLASVDSTKGRLILAMRISALWLLTWAILVPAAVLAVWLVPRTHWEWTVLDVAVDATIWVVGFCTLMWISLLVQTMFAKPFTLIVNWLLRLPTVKQ